MKYYDNQAGKGSKKRAAGELRRFFISKVAISRDLFYLFGRFIHLHTSAFPADPARHFFAGRPMKVKNWIKTDPYTITRTALLQDAVSMMKSHNIRHLPVVDGDNLVGFITESDLRQFSFPSMVEDIPVYQVMVTNPLTIDAEASIEEAARIILNNKIGGLPVMEDGRLYGVITASDLLAAFIEVMGLLTATTRVDVEVDPAGGGLDGATRILHECGAVIVNVAMDSGEGAHRVYCFRLEPCETGPLVEALEAAGHKVLSVME